MEEELKLDQAVPTLTFEPFTETKKEAAKARANLRRRSIVKRAGKKAGRGICRENRFE